MRLLEMDGENIDALGDGDEARASREAVSSFSNLQMHCNHVVKGYIQ